MRVRLQNDDSGQTFSDQLLAIGNGKLPVDSISGRIQLPADFCNLVTSKNELIEKVFPNILKNYKNNKWLSERAILAPKNIDVHEINNIVLTKIRDQAVLYKSVDTVLEPNEAVNYPSEFLNSIDLSGFPPHVLQLKIGVPIIGKGFKKYKPTKALQWHSTCRKKNNGKPNRGHNLDRAF